MCMAFLSVKELITYDFKYIKKWKNTKVLKLLLTDYASYVPLPNTPSLLTYSLPAKSTIINYALTDEES